MSRQEKRALSWAVFCMTVSFVSCVSGLLLIWADQQPPLKNDGSFSDSGSGTPGNKTFTDSGSPTDGDGGDGGDFLDSGENSDLIVQSIVLNKASYTPGETATATIVVKNQGTGSTGMGFYLHSYRDATLSASCGGGYNFTKYLNALAGGATVSHSFTFTQSTAAGTYTFRSFADGSCTIAEYDENNNQSTLSYSISNMGWDDLIVQSISLDKAISAPGETITATIVIKNQGTAGTGSGYFVYSYRSAPQSVSQLRRNVQLQ